MERMKGNRKQENLAAPPSQRTVSVSEYASGGTPTSQSIDTCDLAFESCLVLSSSRVQLPTVEEVQQTLKQALERLEMAHSNEDKELRQVQQSITTTVDNTETLQKELKTAADEVLRAVICPIITSC